MSPIWFPACFIVRFGIHLTIFPTLGTDRARIRPYVGGLCFFADVEHESLGRFTRLSLSKSMQCLPLDFEPYGSLLFNDRVNFSAECIEYKKVKLRKAVMDRMQRCIVEQGPDNFSIIPSAHTEFTVWEELFDQGLSVPSNADDETLGGAIRTAFTRCPQYSTAPKLTPQPGLKLGI